MRNILFFPALAICFTYPATAQSGNPRETFSDIDDKVVVKLPVQQVCWVMGGNRDSLFGISRNAKGEFGVLFTDETSNPVLQLEALVTLRESHVDQPTAKWNIIFESMGSTNGQDYVYAAALTRPQVYSVLNSGVISFTSTYRTERGLGVINVAHFVDFTQGHIDELARCARSLG